MSKKIFWFAAVVASGYLAHRAYESIRIAGNRKKLISDFDGNYDLDGVSYDRSEHEVVVSGDSTRAAHQYMH